MLLNYDSGLLFSGRRDNQNILHLMIPVFDGNRASKKHRSKEFEKIVNELNYKNYKLGKKADIGMRNLTKQSKITLGASGNERGKALVEYVLNYIELNVKTIKINKDWGMRRLNQVNKNEKRTNVNTYFVFCLL